MEDNLQAVGTEATLIIPNTASLGRLQAMKEDFSLTLKYRTADDWAALKGVEVRAFYMGMKDIPNEEGEAVKCAVFASERECFLSGQLTLVEAVKNLDPHTPVVIIYQGKRNNKSSDGATMIFEVKTLKDA